MPYKLRKAPGRDAYWVVNPSTGHKHSRSPLPYARARAQMSALYAAEQGYVLQNRSRSRRRSSPKRMRGGHDAAQSAENQNSVDISGGRRRSRRRARSPKRWVSQAIGTIKHEGSLSRKASRARKSVPTFACEVLRSPGRFTDQTRRQAQFYVNINKTHRC